MTTPEHQLLGRLFSRNHWYFDHLLQAAASLDPGALTAEAAGSYGSIRETTLHVLDAMTLWNVRLDGQSPTTLAFVPRDADDHRLLSTSRELTSAFLHRLEDRDLNLNHMLSYRNTRGEERSNRIGDAIMQVAVHSAHHLAQVSTLLTQAGGKPLEGDYIYYVIAKEA